MLRKYDTEIYLKNGHILKIRSSNVTISRNGFGDITKLEWKKEGGRELVSIDISEICAVIALKSRFNLRFKK